MSETMTSTEIEDVLSSIRRLVSDELRSPETQSPVPEMLVLTAEQRVDLAPVGKEDKVDGGDDGVAAVVSGHPAAPFAAEGGEAAAPGPDAAIVGVAGRFAALRAVVAERRQSAPDAGGTAAGKVGAVPPSTAAAITGAVPTASDMGRGDPGSATLDMPEVPEAAIWIEGEDDDWVEDWAEPETADFISFPTPLASEGGEVVLLRPAAPAAAVHAVDQGDQPGSKMDAEPEQDHAEPPGGSSLGEALSVPVSAKPVTAEALIAEPVNAGPVTSEISEPEPEPEVPVHPVVQAPAPFALGSIATEEVDRLVAGLDEDQLRVLVRGMIKSELQGELGERITRSIRKMLRAEIARALSARDLP